MDPPDTRMTFLQSQERQHTKMSERNLFHWYAPSGCQVYQMLANISGLEINNDPQRYLK